MRSAFGSIIKRKNRRGEIVSLLARYVNPKDPAKRVAMSFPADAKGQAQVWLEREEKLVEAYKSGECDWVSPQERKRAEEEANRRASVTFADYSRRFLEDYRTASGERPVSATMRKKKEAVRHLDEYFGDMLIGEISEGDINKWLDGGSIKGRYLPHRAYQVLKAIMRKALNEGLVAESPCKRPCPHVSRSKQSEIPAATPDELEAIYRAMPEYSRISVYLAAVFGLRISEVCALQRKSFDFRRKVLRIRHSVGRGEGDVGELILKDTKTESSVADLPIPDDFIPLIREHLDAHCEPGAEAMVIRPRRGRIMSPNTLRKQFDDAKRAAGRPDLHFHTLRATAITAAAQNGATPKETQLFGRHADAEISLNLYQRATETGSRKVANSVFHALVKPERTEEVVRAELDEAEKQLEAVKLRVRTLRDELDGFCAHS